MNVAMILSGGVGKRLGGNVPKQYLAIKGKMVIEYVVDAIKASKTIDKILVVAHEPYASMISHKLGVDVCLGGSERNITLKKGLDYVKTNYNCDNIMIFDAVRPLVTAELADEYMDRLSSFDMVLTAQKITDSLGCYDAHEIDRERYYLLQSPEAYRFENLYEYFDENSKLTEVAQQLPERLTKYLNFDFADNIKITYKYDLVLAEQLLGLYETRSKFDVKRLKEYLGKNYPVETDQWINELPQIIDCLKYKWQFDDYTINPNSHFGIIMRANSRRWGDVVVKLIPPFIGRFEGEVELYRRYANSGVMCPLYDSDATFCALLIKCGDPGDCADFNDENFVGLRRFFDRLNDSFIAYKDKGFNNYREILTDKSSIKACGKNAKVISDYVNLAIDLFDRYFECEDTYLLLGDAHKYNLIKDGGIFLAIDPIGYVAPKEIEFARFIGTALTENLDEAKNTLVKTVEFFEKYSDRDKLIAALIIDVAFRLHNTTFENDDDVLADKWIYVLGVIEEYTGGAI